MHTLKWAVSHLHLLRILTWNQSDDLCAWLTLLIFLGTSRLTWLGQLVVIVTVTVRWSTAGHPAPFAHWLARVVTWVAKLALATCKVATAPAALVIPLIASRWAGTRHALVRWGNRHLAPFLQMENPEPKCPTMVSFQSSRFLHSLLRIIMNTIKLLCLVPSIETDTDHKQHFFAYFLS